MSEKNRVIDEILADIPSSDIEILRVDPETVGTDPLDPTKWSADDLIFNEASHPLSDDLKERIAQGVKKYIDAYPDYPGSIADTLEPESHTLTADEKNVIDRVLSFFPAATSDIAANYMSTDLPGIGQLDPIGLSLLHDTYRSAGIRLEEAETEEIRPKPAPVSKPAGQFRQHWIDSVPVEDLKVGDHIRHPNIGYERIIVSIKPHPKGGVQVKTRPGWIYSNRCANPDGKILKARITGRARRWDGKTMIEVGR